MRDTARTVPSAVASSPDMVASPHPGYFDATCGTCTAASATHGLAVSLCIRMVYAPILGG